MGKNDERITVEELSESSEVEWDDFVRGHPRATSFHLLAWKQTVEQGLGHKPLYYLARVNRRLVGVLPCFEIRSALFGRAAISVPAGVRGGVLSEHPSISEALLARTLTRSRMSRARYLELRAEHLEFDNLPTSERYVTFRADLAVGEEALLKNMDRKRRQMLSYARRARYEGRFGTLQDFSTFYELFSRSMRSHGTPVYSRRFIRGILENFGAEASLYFVYHQGTALAGILNLMFRDTLMPFYIGTDRTKRPRALEEFAYWSLMQWAIGEGYRWFDFGRSRRDTGAYKFKARWGMEEVPLAYQYGLIEPSELPDTSPANPRFNQAIRIWRRLPLRLTSLLGPWLARQIP